MQLITATSLFSYRSIPGHKVENLRSLASLERVGGSRWPELCRKAALRRVATAGGGC